jgi:hypothetical protein
MKPREEEEHPSFGMIVAHRVSASPPGAALFDSDIRHQHYVTLSIHRASRKRDLHRDWIHQRNEIIEVELSEAQWASFLSSPNTSGVPCTIAYLHGERIEPLPFAPRLEQSMKETKAAATAAFGEIVAALEAYEETPSTPAKAKREALATLRAAIKNAVPNVTFAGKSLTEHAENVVQKARSDIEAMVAQHAAQMGIAAPETPLLEGTATKEDNQEGGSA